jgi:glycosyltransferase involved in cell wall biosynthesis
VPWDRIDAICPAPVRVAIVAPPWFELPPRGYGGIEWICYLLAEGLTARGHDVTLIGAGSRHTSARFLSTYDVPPSLRLGEPIPEVVHQAEVDRFLARLRPEIVHDHTLLGPLLARGRPWPTVVTAHGPVQGELGDYYRKTADDISLVAISDSQRRLAPDLP